MATLSLVKDANFRDIEDALKILENSSEVSLRLPNSFKDKGVFGIEGLVCQLIATWFRRFDDDRIFHSYVENGTKEGFDDLGNSFYGICALKYSSSILTTKKLEVKKDLALSHSYERVRQVMNGDYKSAYKGPYVAIPSIKSKGLNKEFNSPFYNNRKVKGATGFRDVISSVLQAIVPQYEKSLVVDDVIEDLSEIVRELFDNTHKHGRENEVGDVLENNFRAVIFSTVDITEKSIQRLLESKAEGVLGFAVDWLQWMKDTGRNLSVLDVTVVDSGPGYARRWTGKRKETISQDEEAQAIVNCFAKNSSSSLNYADGSGLTNVLNDLRKHRGWFRLRTGSVSVGQSYFLGGGATEISASCVVKEDCFVEGASFNLVIPLLNLSSTKGTST